MIVKLGLEFTATGNGGKVVTTELERIEAAAKKAKAATEDVGKGFASGTSKAGAFADATGRVSTTLARSADTLGLNAGAFRALDDVMDVAELGFNNVTKAAAGFNAASVGVAGAGLAIGLAFGKWLNTFPAVQRAADSLFHSMFRFVGLAPEIIASAGPIAEFSKRMAASDLEAKRKQVEGMRGQGMSGKDIEKLYGNTITAEMKEQLGLSEKQLKVEDAQAKAAEKKRQELEEISRLLRGEKSLTAMLGDFRSLRGLQMPGIATSYSDDRRGGVTAQAQSLMGALMGGGMATSLNLSWSKEQQINREGEAAAVKKHKEATEQLISTFGTLASQLTNLSQTVGGFGGKLLGILASLSSGAGGIFSGIQGWKDSSGVGGILGKLGKFSAGLGIVGSAIGAVGGLIGGIKSLFGGKSKEQKAAEAAQKKQAEAEKQAALDEAKRVKIEGLKSAQSAAESLMGRGLTGEWVGALAGKVQEALLKSGLGYMASGPLRDSQAFMGAQGAAGDVAQLLAGMRAGGALDAGLLGAAGQGAGALRDQAIEAAKAAGLEGADATKAGFGAIAPILREMLNASIQSGQQLSADQQALLDEAKANGITIIADPMVESLGVQKDMLKELQAINGSGVSRGDSFASGTRGLRLVKRNMLARIHEGEGMLVVPRDEMASMTFRSFRAGTPRDDEDRIYGPGRNLPVPPDGGGGYGGGGDSGSPQTPAEAQAAIEEAIASIQPITVQNPISIQIVDQSPVKTVEGQRAFGRLCVGEVERALQQSRGSLRVMIEQISRKAVA